MTCGSDQVESVLYERRSGRLTRKATTICNIPLGLVREQARLEVLYKLTGCRRPCSESGIRYLQPEIVAGKSCAFRYRIAQNTSNSQRKIDSLQRRLNVQKQLPDRLCGEVL